MNNEEERSKQYPATHVLILTKPRRRKLQAMEIKSAVWFLTAAPVEERSNDAETQKPKRRSPNPGNFSPITKLRRWKLDRTHGFSTTLVEEKNTFESGFDFLFWIWFVHGFLGLGTAFGKKERKNKKQIRVSSVLAELKSSSEGSFSIKQNQVLWARFPAQLLCSGKSSAIHSVYTPKLSSWDSVC